MVAVGEGAIAQEWWPCQVGAVTFQAIRLFFRNSVYATENEVQQLSALALACKPGTRRKRDEQVVMLFSSLKGDLADL